MISGAENVIRISHVGPLRRQPRSGVQYAFSFDTPPTLDEVASTYLRELLAEGDRNRSDIARVMGISERQLYRMLSEMK